MKISFKQTTVNSTEFYPQIKKAYRLHINNNPNYYNGEHVSFKLPMELNNLIENEMYEIIENEKNSKTFKELEKIISEINELNKKKKQLINKHKTNLNKKAFKFCESIEETHPEYFI